jgi:hypothetical protein
LKRLAGALLEGVSLGTLDAQAFAPATGYISFFTLALYVAGLVLMMPAPEDEQEDDKEARRFIRAYRRLPPGERLSIREAMIEEQTDGAVDEEREALPPTARAELTVETKISPEETVVARKREL